MCHLTFIIQSEVKGREKSTKEHGQRMKSNRCTEGENWCWGQETKHWGCIGRLLKGKYLAQAEAGGNRKS